MPGEVAELFEQVIGVFLAVFFHQLFAGDIGIGTEEEILPADFAIGRRIFQPAGALKIRARLRLQLREITPAAAEQHPDAIMRPGNHNRQRARLQSHHPAVAQAVGNGDGIALPGRRTVNRALQRGAESFAGALVQPHVQVPEDGLGLRPGRQQLQLPLENGTGNDLQSQTAHNDLLVTVAAGVVRQFQFTRISHIRPA